MGDMLRIEDMEAAARGAALMFFCFPVKEGLLEATAIAALAAQRAGMRGIVNLSQWCAKIDSHSPHSRKHGLSEAVRIPLGPPLQPAHGPALLHRPYNALKGTNRHVQWSTVETAWHRKQLPT